MDDKRTAPDDLDRYVGKEIESFYGADYLKKARMNAPAPPPKKRMRGFTLSVTLCAAVFLTGALMLAGVFFTKDFSDVPTSSDTLSSKTVNSSSLYYEKDESSDIYNNASADERTDTETESVNNNHNKTVVDTESVDNENKKTDTYTESINSKKNNTDIEASSGNNENKITDVDTESINKDLGSRHGYSLPELPSDAAGYTPPSEPNSSDIVVTGRRARAGVGVFLMISSLCCAAALRNFYKDEEK